jgi:CxxC-x17-CxxC domain-containing protein
MRLLGGMVVTKIQLAAMGRVDIPQEERKDFYLYVDEFQNFATESFANILSEARKYRLNLILAHQYINQLVFDSNSVVRDAVFGNVGTMVTFRVGADDAEFLEKEFEPVFMMNDLVNLAKYNVYLKLMIDGITGDAFSAATLPPADLSDTTGNEEKAIKVSRERYGNSRAEVEEKIARWSGMLDAEDYENLAKKNAAARISEDAPRYRPDNKRETVARSEKKFPAPAARQEIRKEYTAPKEIIERKIEPAAPPVIGAIQINNTPPASDVSRNDVGKEKPMFSAVCDTCEEKILVPFQPDPTRPTFCKECLKDYQRAKARAQNRPIPADQPKRYEKKEEEKKEYQPSAFVPKERPISLNQISHIAPKKFKRTRPEVNLREVRELLDKTKDNNG